MMKKTISNRIDKLHKNSKAERKTYALLTYDDECSKKRLDLIQKRLDKENKTSDEKVKEIFEKIGIKVDLKNFNFTKIE